MWTLYWIIVAIIVVALIIKAANYEKAHPKQPQARPKHRCTRNDEMNQQTKQLKHLYNLMWWQWFGGNTKK